MKNKYYIPSVEEFAFGLEYEYLEKLTEREDFYEPQTITKYSNIDLFDSEIKAGLIKIKYLTKEEIVDLGFVEYDTSNESAVESLSRKCGLIETTYYHPNKFSLKKHKDTEEYQNYYHLGYTCEIIHPKTLEKKLRGFEYNGVIKNKSELIQLINNLKRTS